MGARHLYAHIPFCRSRCRYCDFFSESLQAGEEARVRRYFQALEEEFAATLSCLELPLKTVHVGGGTPTAVPRSFLLAFLRRVLRGGPVGEFTVEVNPGTADSTYLEELMKMGVTRLSLGVQSFDPGLLRSLGRGVEPEEIDAALRAVKALEWPDWNLDLIFGVPGQDAESMRRDIRRAVEAGPTHISLYDLTYTDEYLEYLDGEARVSPAEARLFAEEHYAEAVNLLEEAGYRRYEISNFALPGHESEHNLAYWRGCDYAGIGAAAVSTLNGKRLTNPESVDEYLRRRPPGREGLSPSVRLYEKTMLGLRTREGVSEREVAPVLDDRGVEEMVGRGLLTKHYGTLCLTREGLDLCNSVLTAILREV